MATKRIRVLSYGGGLDSFAMLVDSIQRNDKPDYCVFIDTGSAKDEDGEWPSTYRHIEQYGRPLAKKHGIKFVWVTSDMIPVRNHTSLLTYYESINRLPFQNNRLCTITAKVERFNKWLSRTLPGKNVEVWIGFEAGEGDRAAKDPHATKKCGSMTARINRFPLIEQKLCRCRCEVLVRTSKLRSGGFPVPRKSACWFCPFGSRGDFKTLKREMPKQFRKISDYESRPDVGVSGGVKYYLTGDKPLAEDVKKSYTPSILQCPVCKRMPRASKATGANYLQPSEYVQLQDPVWGELMMHGPEAAAVAEEPLVSTAPGYINIPLESPEGAVALWLAEFFSFELGPDMAAFPHDLDFLDEVLEYLDYYEQMAPIDTDRTTLTVPNARDGAVSLAAKIRERL